MSDCTLPEPQLHVRGFDSTQPALASSGYIYSVGFLCLSLQLGLGSMKGVFQWFNFLAYFFFLHSLDFFSSGLIAVSFTLKTLTLCLCLQFGSSLSLPLLLKKSNTLNSPQTRQLSGILDLGEP